jgi:hypothetical protein
MKAFTGCLASNRGDHYGSAFADSPGMKLASNNACDYRLQTCARFSRRRTGYRRGAIALIGFVLQSY